MGYCAECTARATFRPYIDRLCCPLLYPDGIPSKILAETVWDKSHGCPKFVEKPEEDGTNDEGEENGR